MDQNKIMQAAGNLYLADVLAGALEQIRPHSDKHRRMIERMKRDLIEIRNAECQVADREALQK